MIMSTPPHPGGLIAEYLEDNESISLRALARNLGVAPSTLSKVASGKSPITPDLAVRLEAGTGIAARLLLAMQATFDLSIARGNIDISAIIPPKNSDIERLNTH